MTSRMKQRLKLLLIFLVLTALTLPAESTRVVVKGTYPAGETNILAAGQSSTKGVFFDIGVKEDHKPRVGLGVLSTSYLSPGDIKQIGKVYYPSDGKVTRYYIEKGNLVDGRTYTCMLNDGGMFMGQMSSERWQYQAAKGNRIKNCRVLKV